MIIEQALGTGLRVTELANLKVKDLYLKKGQNALQVRNGKGGKDRVVQFSSKLKKMLLEYQFATFPGLFTTIPADSVVYSPQNVDYVVNSI